MIHLSSRQLDYLIIAAAIGFCWSVLYLSGWLP